MFIVGVNANDVEITRRSNAVRPDSATPPVPGAPQAFVATDTGLLIQLNWTLGSGTITGQRIYRRVDGGAFVLWQSVAANAISAQDSGVTMGHLYDYYVVAFNGAGDSAASNQGSVLFGS